MAETDRVPLTPGGLARLEAELKKFKDERPQVIHAIGEARAHGDLSENAEYHAARERLGLVEANIRKLEDLIGRAEVIDPKRFNDTRVRFGATVTVYDHGRDEEATYQIVGDAEADISQGLVSVMAPLGRALVGKEEADEVEFKAPGGVRRFEIIKVEYR
jgi:transcription elongation factor GreA